MENYLNICNIPDDCIINILKYCDIPTLGRVASTCKRLNHIIKTYDCIWLLHSRTVLGSNINSPSMEERSMPVLTYMDRCRVSRNWELGIVEKTSVVRYVQCMPWMCMERDSLYVSKGNRIIKDRRDKNGHIIPNARTWTHTHLNDDVSKFAINGDDIFSVGWDGSLCRLQKSSLHCYQYQVLHNREVLGMDTRNDILVSGSRDQTIKIWKIGPRHMPLDMVGEFNTDIRVLCLSLLPSTRSVVAGMPGTSGIHPLSVFDIENETLLFNLGDTFENGGGTIDIYVESENHILTCGYDTTLKLWDLRTPTNCVNCWVEPYDNILYCVKSDDSYTLVAGANRSGYYHIWDKRTSSTVVTHHNYQFPSPVYSLTFDACHVFTALARATVMDCFMPGHT